MSTSEMNVPTADVSDGIAQQAGSIINNMVDSAHPYYLHPSDFPGMVLVSSVFDGKGFGGWRRAVVIALSAKNKLGFIDGTLTMPSPESGLQKAWGRCSDMVLSWLLNSLSKEIAESVLYSQTAKELWRDIEDRFGQASGAKLFQLQKELNAVTQNNLSVCSYFTKMKNLWDELDALNTFSGCVCECECGGKLKSIKAHQDERLLQFLMGLNDSFTGVRSNILLSSPLPNIGQAYSLVIQEEKQREIHNTPCYPGDSASFMVDNPSGPPRKFIDYKGKKSYDPKRSALNCNYCKKVGHTIDQCYKLKGYPPDFKFTRQRKFQGGTQANNVSSFSEENEPVGGSDPKSLSKENVAQLLDLLQQLKVNHTGSSADASASLSCSGPFLEEPSGN